VTGRFQGDFPVIRVILDAATRGKLSDLKQSLELCDESGTVLARLVPVLDPSRDEHVEETLSEEEWQRRLPEPEYSTEEVLRHLEGL
jgi:hypothetical protein